MTMYNQSISYFGIYKFVFKYGEFQDMCDKTYMNLGITTCTPGFFQASFINMDSLNKKTGDILHRTTSRRTIHFVFCDIECHLVNLLPRHRGGIARTKGQNTNNSDKYLVTTRGAWIRDQPGSIRAYFYYSGIRFSGLGEMVSATIIKTV
jgi:hypothetical protein